ncbi:type II secretion system F family protein [Cellulomonas sp. McL0617]|uniref:type II secretion system F family protein n=1 Tax=Cellulomonas sp. McL0617 TaxID=3415675 RepID=UPI003CF0B782
MSVLVALAVAAAVVVLGVRVPRRVGRPATTGGGRPRRAPARALELSAVVAGAAAQLRSGASPADAWQRALGSRAPTVAGLVERSTGPRARRGARTQRAAAVVAAARLSEELGAPLATVLDRVGAGLAADEESEGERIAALAGPRATAQVLVWLPALGLLLGAALGADPVAVIVRGGTGTYAAIAGAALVVLGRWWTASLLARAARDDVGDGRW